jgi:hypothetical protein
MPSADNLPVVVIACRVFEHLLERLLPGDLAARVTYLDYGLHSVPEKLTAALQETIDAVVTPGLVVLGYGLCGNGLDGLRAGHHTLLVARADDCIAILLGSYARYRQEFDAVPGTYYLTKGWLESGSHPLKEFREYSETYGPEKAQVIMDAMYRHYERLVLVAHTPEDLEAYRPRALEVARYCERWGMRYEEILGSDSYVRQLAEIAADLNKAGGEFIVVPPGGVLRQADFLRQTPVAR